MAISGTIAAVGAAATATSIYTGNKQAKAQKRAQRQAARQAEDARRQADREFNRANQKSPNVAALFKKNKASGGLGTSGTFLTGAGGAPTTGGMLGRTTLLGG
jgi:type II secretory pathway pseudopilin PulG